MVCISDFRTRDLCSILRFGPNLICRICLAHIVQIHPLGLLKPIKRVGLVSNSRLIALKATAQRLNRSKARTGMESSSSRGCMASFLLRRVLFEALAVNSNLAKSLIEYN